MVVRFSGLVALVCLLPNVLSQSYQNGNYGNYLHNQFPQGAGGSYPNQPQNSNYNHHQHSSHQQPNYQHSSQTAQFGARLVFN